MQSSLVTHTFNASAQAGAGNEFQNNLDLDASSKRNEKNPPNPLKIQCSGSLGVSLGPVDSVILP